MIRSFKLGVMVAALGAVVCCSLALAAAPKIAVTDLSYEEKVSEYFKVVNASSKSNLQTHSQAQGTNQSYAAANSLNASQESNYYEHEGYYTYIDRGELHGYTNDLKDALLNGGLRLTQARPYSGNGAAKIFDIIGRIKQGMYPGADYVLFGTVSDISFRQESMPLAIGTSATVSLSLDLVADFSLIDTRSYEVKAAFSAIGSGIDTRIVSRAGDRIVFNRGKVIHETSRSLALAATSELLSQFRSSLSAVPVPSVNPVPPPALKANLPRPPAPGYGPVIIY